MASYIWDSLNEFYNPLKKRECLKSPAVVGVLLVNFLTRSVAFHYLPLDT
jgi:hypothetical protein